ncbi:MAG: DUF4160 domain-containing protein [Deltaproteobacteria bacterium]|nr:DUF4160 domain-containing protein [Deltaproteobacteria bacterium]
MAHPAIRESISHFILLSFTATKNLFREGNLPSRVLSLVLEWASLHRKELFEDWKLATEKRPLKGIEPLV